MTSLTRKRKFAGETISEKRKTVPEPPKLSPAAKPRSYVLITREYVSYYTERTSRYPSRAAREQAKLDATKKARSEVQSRWRWYKDYSKEPRFVDIDE